MLRIHASYHKCLTKYYLRVMHTLYNRILPKQFGYYHFESIQGLLYNRAHKYSVVSTNGFAIQPQHFSTDFRISRFIRDPRDLIVSGYFYHLRGAEPWFRFVGPTETYWSAINGHVPSTMPSGVSYAEFLSELTKEEGLLAEIEFRKHHFQSMLEWTEDERIKLFKYEDVLGQEATTFDAIFRHYEVPAYQRQLGVAIARQFALSGRKRIKTHIRNPQPNQWKEHFTPRVKEVFYDQYLPLLHHVGYLE
ncbi:MAG TPA: hypothetical protein DCE41_17940 [Cytophagales bacterium]|nr:hypothetical protein [Cytophagales bacterium]